jgi:predicted dehydrogenase
MNRRTFIEKSALCTAALSGTFFVPSLSNDRKIKVGLIGSGWYGMVISKAALKAGGVEISAICDVDSEHLKKSGEELEKLQGTKPKSFKQYQDLINMKGLDAIFIATPPQWHALQFIAACEKGLPIYCEKPLAYDPMEGLEMIKAANKAGNIVQIGFQRRQSKAFQHAKQYIKEGRAGNINQIVAQIHYQAKPGDTTIQAPPASLDWDEWCGPAPKLEYRPSIGHFSWRLEKEYGNGHLVDWGIHHIDIIRQIMDDGVATEFKTTGGLYVLKDKITTPDTLTANMAFSKAPVVWQHRLWGAGDINPEFNNGVFFHGDVATIYVADSRFVVIPADKNAERVDQRITTDGGMQELHLAEFIEAVRQNNAKKISCTVEDGFASTTNVQLAMMAYYTGSIVKWDHQKKTIIDNHKAAGLLKREYRSKWRHPAS